MFSRRTCQSITRKWMRSAIAAAASFARFRSMASIFFSSYSFLFSFIPSFLLKYTKRKFSNSLDSRRSRQVVACIRAFVFLLFFPFCCFSRLRSFVRRDACGYPGTLRLFSVGHSRDAIFALRLLLLCCFLFPFFSLSLFLFPLLLFS